MKKEIESFPVEFIEKSIHLLRGQKVMLDVDLANLYGVETKKLNQAVKRNIDRFPEDFMFQLNSGEKNHVVTNCDHLKKLKFSSQNPYAFTEQGVAMLSSVLRSPQAIMVNIEIMRAFVRMRHIFSSHQKLSKEVQEIKSFLLKNSQHHSAEFKKIWQSIDRLASPPEVDQRKIGFRLN